MVWHVKLGSMTAYASTPAGNANTRSMGGFASLMQAVVRVGQQSHAPALAFMGICARYQGGGRRDSRRRHSGNSHIHTPGRGGPGRAESRPATEAALPWRVL